MIIYHTQTKEKVGNLNNTLGDKLTKYLASKTTKLWDEYLLQALFVSIIQAHNILKYSLYYLLYGQHLYLHSDDNFFRILEVVATTIAKHKMRIVDI